MMRFLPTAAIAGVTMLLAGQSIAQEGVKIALVDFARVQREYYRTTVERDRFNKESEGAKTTIEERRAQFQELLEKQKGAQQQLGDPTLSDDAKQKVLEAAQERDGQLKSLQREIMELEQKTGTELQTEANTIQRSLTTEIYDVIGQVAETKKLDLVLNRTFGINGVPTVAYSSTDNLPDISTEVINKLNENAPEGWTPPAAEGAEAPAAEPTAKPQ